LKHREEEKDGRLRVGKELPDVQKKGKVIPVTGRGGP
jgi:hypothetical protein